MLDENEEFPERLWQQMADMGLLGIAISEKYGGSGGNILDMTLVIEELSRGMAAAGLAYFLSTCFGGKSIGFYGSEEQKKFYLSGLAGGRFKFALALTEPSGGTDILSSLETRAIQEGDHFIVNGQKVFITGAHVSDYLITVLRTTKTEKKSHGVSILVIPADTPGIEIRRMKKLGIKATGTNEIFFNDVRVPVTSLLGEKDKGWYQLVSTLNNERITLAALCVGIAQAALEDALVYAQERHAFGRPIGQFQAIQHQLANAATEIELSRMMTYKAAWLQAKERPCMKEAAMAKLFASETALRVTNVGMQVMGGYGYMMEYDMQRYFRDARLFSVAPINNEMLRNIIGESLGLPKSY
jgi:alkylation response protein AidB-like acyl-CoA dehydrogenase